MQARAELQQAEALGDGERIALAHTHLHDVGAFDAKSRAQSLILGLGFQMNALDQPVNSFSGGWRMRLQLARALMCPSDLLLLDEPFASLDEDLADLMRDQIRTLIDKNQMMILMATHDERDAYALRASILRLEGSPAHLEKTINA